MDYLLLKRAPTLVRWDLLTRVDGVAFVAGVAGDF